MIPIIIIALGLTLLIGSGFVFYKTFNKRKVATKKELNGNDTLVLKPDVVVTQDNCMKIAIEHALWDSHSKMVTFKPKYLQNVIKGDENGGK